MKMQVQTLFFNVELYFPRTLILENHVKIIVLNIVHEYLSILVVSSCFARNDWGHRDFMVLDKVYM